MLLCLCFWGGIGCSESTVEEGLCVLMLNPVRSHTCVQRSASVCVCVFGPSCQTAAIFVSQTGRENWRGTLIVWSAILSRKVRSAPRKFVMLFHLSDSCTVGVRGRVFVHICCWHLNTHTLVCSRPIKVTKKFIWPCCEILFSPISLPGLGQKWANSCYSPILDRSYFIIYPPTPWRYTGLFCLLPNLRFSFLQSSSKSTIIHSCSVQNLPDPHSPISETLYLYLHLLIICTRSPSLFPTPIYLTISTQGLQYIVMEALVMPSELNTFSSTG